jgi:hypothetical protein
MPTVWMRRDPKHRTRFHRSPDCRQLTKGPARGDGHELIAVDLEDVLVRPCHSCYPDAPQIKMRHPYCYSCRSPYPCEHNGGVKVTSRHGHTRWVWPDTNQMPLYRRSA